MNPVDLRPIPVEQKTQSNLDLFLIFAGANVVATTFITGATLKAGLSFSHALFAATAGSLIGALLVALLVPGDADDTVQYLFSYAYYQAYEKC